MKRESREVTESLWAGRKKRRNESRCYARVAVKDKKRKRGKN